MSGIVHTGSWFLPNSEKKLPGHIVVEEKSIRLEIFGKESIEGSDVLDMHNSPILFYHPLILGDAEKLITLHNCKWIGLKLVGKDLCQITYEIGFTFIGCHIHSEESFKVKSGTFTFPHIASWFDGENILDKMPMSETSQTNLLSTNQKQEEERVIINDNLTLVFFDRFEKNYPSLGFHHSIKFRKYVYFFYKDDISFNELLKDAGTFLRLLEFVCGKPLALKISDVGIRKQNASFGNAIFDPDGDIVKIQVGNKSLNKGLKIDQDSRHQNFMLFSSWNTTKENLNQIILKWFSNKSYFNIYDFYLDSNNWFQDSGAVISNVMFNNRFLNVIQGLEAFYNKTKEKTNQNDDFQRKKNEVLKVIDDPTLLEWTKENLQPKSISLQDKLNWILKRFSDLLKTLFDNNLLIANFPNYAKKIRNTLSHGRNAETNLGTDLHVNFFIGRIILAICILESLGVDKIAEKIYHYDEFSRNIHEIELRSQP